MKARIEIQGEDLGKGKLRFLELRVLPRIGELLETDFCGTCQVIQVIHTPQSKEHDAVIVLQRSKETK